MLIDKPKAEVVEKKVSLPANEATKASFPPGCRVICFDKTGFHFGTVQEVLVSTFLPSGRTNGNHYKVDINGSLNTGRKGNGGNYSRIFSEQSLRFGPGCRVEVAADYFGSVFRFSSMAEGVITGCFDVPFSQHTSLKNLNSEAGQYIYSIRIKFKGMDEAIEAHGVPPEHVYFWSKSENDQILSEITVNHNGDTLDYSSLLSKDIEVCRPEDIPINHSHTSDSGDVENQEFDGDRSILRDSSQSMVSTIRGSLSSGTGAGANDIRRRNLQMNSSIAGIFRTEKSHLQSPSPERRRSKSSPFLNDAKKEEKFSRSTSSGSESSPLATEENSKESLTTGTSETESEEVGGISVEQRKGGKVSKFGIQLKTKSPSPSIQSQPPTEGCYLTYKTSNGGYMAIKYSHTTVEDAMGFWFPGAGEYIQDFKFKENQGRSDIIKNVIGRDSKKKYFSGWCQFVKAAHKSNGVVCKWSNKGGIEVDLYVFRKETCQIQEIKNGEFCDVSKIDAISCLPAGNAAYDGVKKGEYNKFLNLGFTVGASIAIDRA